MSQSKTSVPIAIPVHDTQAWPGRALYLDLLALSVMLLAGLGLAIDLYAAGYASAYTGPRSSDPSVAPLLRLGVEAVTFVAAFAWTGARLIRAAYRDLPGSR